MVRYHVYIGENPSECLKREEVIKPGRFKAFMLWLFQTSIGQLDPDQNITFKSLKSSWYSFRSAYERATYNTISRKDGDDVLNVSLFAESIC